MDKTLLFLVLTSVVEILIYIFVLIRISSKWYDRGFGLGVVSALQWADNNMPSHSNFSIMQMYRRVAEESPEDLIYIIKRSKDGRYKIKRKRDGSTRQISLE